MYSRFWGFVGALVGGKSLRSGLASPGELNLRIWLTVPEVL